MEPHIKHKRRTMGGLFLALQILVGENSQSIHYLSVIHPQLAITLKRFMTIICQIDFYQKII